MKFISHTPQAVQPHLSEKSSLFPARDPGTINTIWKHSNNLTSIVNSLNQQMKTTVRELAKLKQIQIGDFGFFPFKLYTLPDSLRPTADTGSFTASANWRTFKVRSGQVLTKFITGSNSGSNLVMGTDQVNWPDSNILPEPFSFNDIVVPLSASHYWFWVQDMTLTSSVSGNYILRYGSDPTVMSAGNPIPWNTFPSASSQIIPIGYVDTVTSGSINMAFVRQYQRTDVVSTGAGHYITMSLCLDGSTVTYFVDAFQSGSGGP